MTNELIHPNYHSLIFEFRGLKVMIDADLASLYGTETKVLKQQVKRNIDRFPEDFMFQLTHEEKNQLVTKCDRLHRLKHSATNPFAFTEQGVAMLSSVLRSSKAISINIEIIRAFARYRAMLIEHEDLRSGIRLLDDKINYVLSICLTGSMNCISRKSRVLPARSVISDMIAIKWRDS